MSTNMQSARIAATTPTGTSRTSKMDGGGLFGDLPSAKSDPKPAGGQDDPSCANVTTKDTISNEESTETTKSTTIPVTATKKGSSLVESIGNAGTAFAFVPAALRRKKVAGGGTEEMGTRMPGAKRPRSAAAVPVAQAPLERTHRVEAGAAAAAAAGGGSIRKPYEEEERRDQEPDWLRQLHSSVQPQDRYDPLVPNDYLAYRERLRAEQDQMQMERAAKEQLEVQRRLRERIEEERRAAEEDG